MEKPKENCTIFVASNKKDVICQFQRSRRSFGVKIKKVEVASGHVWIWGLRTKEPRRTPYLLIKAIRVFLKD